MNVLAMAFRSSFAWVLQSTWEAAVVALLILVAQWLIGKRLSLAWRYGLWFLLIARLVTPWSPSSTFSVFNLTKFKPKLSAFVNVSEAKQSPILSSGSFLGVDQPNTHPVQSEPNVPRQKPILRQRDVKFDASRGGSPWNRQVDWLEMVRWIWLVGVTFFAVRLILRNYRFTLRLRRHAAISEPAVLRLFKECSSDLGITRRVNLIETEEVETPAVHGLRQKRLLLPDGIFERFSSDELRYIFLHELAHIKRHDLEINWLVSLLQTLHWFNPILWFAFQRMRADRELAADALALTRTLKPESIQYGETILKVLEGLTRQSNHPHLVGIVEGNDRIAQRIRAIASYGSTKPWKWPAVVIVAILGISVLTDARSVSLKEVAANKPSAGISAAKEETRAPNARSSFEATVLDYDSKLAIARATVKFEMEYYTSAPITNVVLTDAQGKARTEFDRADLKHFVYRAEMPEYVAPWGEWIGSEVAVLPAQMEIKISKGMVLGGSVTDEAGRPVTGAELFFDRPFDVILEGYPISSVRWTAYAGQRLAETDAQGLWKAKCLYPTVQWASIRIHHTNFSDAVYSTEVTKAMEADKQGRSLPFEDLVQKRAKFVLNSGVSLVGKVVDDAGVPMDGIQVRYADRRSENPSWDLPMGTGTVTTDQKGIFRIAHLPQRPIFLTVQAPDHAPAVLEQDLKAGIGPVEVTLSKGQKLLGQVVDASGNPVPRALLTFMDWSIWQGVKWQALSDENGEFHWNDAPSERFRLHIERDGFIAQEKSMVARGKQVIELKTALQLSGRVVDAANKKPIEHFRVFWADQADRFQQLRRFSLSASNGVYSIDVKKLRSDFWAGGYAHDFLIRIEAEGYSPETSRTFSSRQGDVGKISNDFELQPSGFILGSVLDNEDRAVEGAQVVLKSAQSRLRLAGKPQFENLDSITFPVTDKNGNFRLTPDPTATHLVAVHSRGIAWIEAKALTTNTVLRLQSWAKIEGSAWEYDQPVKNQAIWHFSPILNNRDGPRVGIDFFTLRGTTDSEGKFSFDFVPPGKHRFYRMSPQHGGRSYGGPATIMEAEPGQTTFVKVGGAGRPVIGMFKVKNPYVVIDWINNQDDYLVHTVAPHTPENLKTQEEIAAWRNQESVQRTFDALRNHHIDLAEDGSFQIDEMIPGKYHFSIQIHDPRDREAFAYSRYIASYSGEFSVPVSNEQNSRKPLDIGTFEISLKPPVELGTSMAPEFTTVDLTGKEFKLADFRGKYVLLDFWATWCGPCIAELPYLRAAQKKFESRNDFVLISLSLDMSIQAPRDFVEKNNMPWRHGYLGDWRKTDLPSKYGVQGIPATFLIDPDGKIIAKELLGGSLNSEIQKWLK